MNRAFSYCMTLVAYGILSLSYGQDIPQKQDESLMRMSYAELFDGIYAYQDNNPQYAKDLCHIYLHRSKIDGDTIRSARAYYLLAGFYQDKLELHISYLDSSIEASKSFKHPTFPSIAYLSKGVFLENKGQLLQAIESQVLAEKYATEAENKTLLFYAKFNIGTLKKRVKKYREAKRLFRECLEFDINKAIMSHNDSLSALLTLNELVDTYRLNGQIDSAKYLNDKSFYEYVNIKEQYLFTLNKGVFASYDNEHTKAIRILDSIRTILNNQKGPSEFDLNYYVILANYYHGHSSKKLNKTPEAIASWRNIDSIVQHNNHISYQSKKAYLGLVNIFKENGDRENEIVFIDKYLRLDSLIAENLHPLDERIIEDYDRPAIIEQKQEILNDFNREVEKRGELQRGALLGGLVLIVVIGYYAIRHKKYKKRLKILLEKTETSKETTHQVQKEHPNNNVEGLKIEPSVIEEILQKLDEFERHQGFLKRDVTLTRLAEIFKTNTKYLSTVVNHCKEKNFASYLNELRINYFIEQAQTNSNYTKYTIKAISRECGFNSSEVFSKNFYTKTGIYPSFFLKQVKKNY